MLMVRSNAPEEVGASSHQRLQRLRPSGAVDDLDLEPSS
jgi:hypothetical protein